ncbi:MAG: hypothetical protein F4X02_15365 [Chloroflexi bacterium]|nr:hypothetical protein [Chloroflexota bacterium]
MMSDASDATARRLSLRRLLPAVILLAILLFGGALRLLGHNWDDFAHIHPDERFLTALLLPQIGGGNSFTDDRHNFPDQQILASSSDGGIRNRDDLRNSRTRRVGAIQGSFASEAALWLVTPDRVRTYADLPQAERALKSREVDALLISQSENRYDAGEILSVATVSSKELQSLRCEHYYPETRGVGGYFDARCSPLNPHNADHGFFVYGTLPLFLAHFGSDIVREAAAAGSALLDYQGGHLVWRGISMIFDLLAIAAVYALGRRIRGEWVGLLAALFYASAPLAIQKAHFGTVNAAASFMVTMALYSAVAVQQRGRLRAYLLFGLFTGAAVACRINLAPLAAVIVFAAFVQAAPALLGKLHSSERSALMTRHILGLALAGFGAFLAFRLLNPYAFTGPGFLGLLPNYRWLENLERVNAGVSGLQDFPPNWQWLARPAIIYPLKDMLFWGMGLAFGVLAWFGWCRAAYRLLTNRRGSTDLLVPLLWVGGYFLFMSRLTAMNMRYFLPLYGSLAVLASCCLSDWRAQAQTLGRGSPCIAIPMVVIGALLTAVGGYQLINGVTDVTAITALLIGISLVGAALVPGLSRWRPLLLTGFAVAFSVVWGLMFTNVYRHQNTLVQSGHYIFERIPGDFSMRVEGADETVPLINIAVHNTGYAWDDMQGPPFNRANLYRENQPIRIEFRAPASGTVAELFAPHLGDPFDDPEPEELQFAIFAQADTTPLATAALRRNLVRELHPLGRSYNIPFEKPLHIVEGERYVFVMEVAAGSDDVIGSGSVVLSEGSWDNRATGVILCSLPEGITLADDPQPGLVSSRDCHATQPHHAIINPQDQIMSHPVDDQVKYDNITRTLDMGDYLTIASNRFYDSERRNLQRWPLTTLYYEKLFAGELGYELEAVFEETFEFGPWRVADQHLPIHDSPAWLNELEADESFHVYDHPTVFIFRKSEDYSRAAVAAALSQVSLKQHHELQNASDEAQLLGVLNWRLTKAQPVPTALTFPPEERATQRAGGTWSQRFFSDSPVNSNQVVGVAVWYATLFIFGAIAFPLVFTVFPKMADGGYGVSKLVGLLIVAWFAWAVSSLKIPIWSQAGILLSLALTAAVSAALVRIQLVEFLRDNWKRLAWIELISLAAFLLMIAVRLTNPDLWHPYKGGEKPMDFAYLNGVLRSTTFPPIDPWFSGGFINYYYFGYVLLGAPTLLLGIVPSFAYNLMIPTIFSLTGLGAFSTAFNLLSRWRKAARGPARSKRPRRRLGNPWVAGMAALVLCVVLGNLDTLRVFGNGLAALGGYRTPLGLYQYLVDEYETEFGMTASDDDRAELSRRAGELHPWDSLRYELHNSTSLLSGLLRGAGRALQGESPPIGSDRWYWGPSRVLAETPGVRGNAITEMPYFTFLYGDLHAHMISMPLILLTLLLLFNEVAQAGHERRRTIERFAAIALIALAVGAIRATNTWDWPSMTLFSVVALAYAWWIRWQATFRPVADSRFYLVLLGALIAAFGATSILAGGALLPLGADAAVTASVSGALRAALATAIAAVILWLITRNLLTRSSALELTASVGGFLFLQFAFALPYTSWYAATYNSIQLWDGGKTPLWAYFDIHGLFLFLVVSLLAWETAIWLRNTRVRALLEHRQLAGRALVLTSAIIALAVVLAIAGYQVALIVLPLVCWISWLFFRPGQSRFMRYALALIGLALSMTLGVEVIVIGGDIGRQNTVFKFYIQVWLLLSVAGGVAFAILWRASQDFSRGLQLLWRAPCVLLFVMAGLFPIMATRARSFDRMAPDLPLTLDGMDYMTRSTHFETSPSRGAGSLIDLNVDYQLIRWMQENVEDSPVIIEGRRPGSEYQWNGRFSIMTGLPSVLGWNFHQRQQRTFYPMNEWIFQRERNIHKFYNTESIDVAVDIIHHFDIAYIISSGLEAVHSTPAGLAKFDSMAEQGLLSVSYEVDGGKIFQVDEEALMRYLVERHS